MFIFNFINEKNLFIYNKIYDFRYRNDLIHFSVSHTQRNKILLLFRIEYDCLYDSIFTLEPYKILRNGTVRILTEFNSYFESLRLQKKLDPHPRTQQALKMCTSENKRLLFSRRIFFEIYYIRKKGDS